MGQVIFGQPDNGIIQMSSGAGEFASGSLKSIAIGNISLAEHAAKDPMPMPEPPAAAKTVAAKLKAETETILNKHGLEFSIDWDHGAEPFLTDGSRVHPQVACRLCLPGLGFARRCSRGPTTSIGLARQRSLRHPTGRIQ